MDGNRKITIVTHSSGFHTDDIFAVATVCLVLEKEGKEYTITRSRDMEVIRQADYVVDVGSIYDPKINRFDHHQEGGAGIRENGIPFASFGLVWREFGPKLTVDIEIANRIEKKLVYPIDAIDNGIQYSKSIVDGIKSFDISRIASLFYPTWREDVDSIDGNFIELVAYATFLLRRMIVSIKDEVDAEKLVLDVYNNSKDKRLIILDNSRYPWQDVLSKFPEPLFVVYENISNKTWSIKGMRDDSSSFVYRKIMPISWAGKRDNELEQISGVPGAVFCHNARFMAVNKTKEGILKMAEIALNS